MFKGYVATKGKRTIESIKGRTEFWKLEDVQHLEEYGGVLADDIILIDIDDKADSEKLDHILTELNINCTKIKTSRGMHFYFKNNGIKANSVHKPCALGFDIDVKLGIKNSVVPLKIKGNLRPMVTTGVIDEVPRWLTVVKKVPDFTGLEEGEGRNQTLFNYILTLQKHGFTKNEVRETITVINEFILADKLPDSELKTILRDESFTEQNFVDENGKWSHFLFAEYLKREYNIVRINNVLHSYKEGVYVSGTYEIEKLIVKHIPTLVKSKRAEVIALLQIIAPEVNLSVPDKIVVNNGLLNINTLELDPFDMEYIAVNKIPLDYNPAAHSPVVDQVLNKISCNNEQLRMLLEEMVGYPLLRRPEVGKCFILTGEGSNGKSTLLDMLTAMLGEDNVSSIGMEELEQRFKVADMVGKLANIGDDISNGYISENAKFKKLVTGEPLMVERKGVDPFKIRNYGKLIFSANEVPRVNDISNGLNRRLVIVPFNARFSSNDPDYNPFIKDELMTKESLEYLLLLGIKGLRRVLYDNNQAFTNVDVVVKELEEYKRMNNPIIQFIEEFKVENEPVQFVYDLYSNWCNSGGMKPLNRNKFVNVMIGAGLEVKQVRVTKNRRFRGIRGERVRIFIRPEDKTESI